MHAEILTLLGYDKEFLSEKVIQINHKFSLLLSSASIRN
jgi:hypothetical protein